MKWNLVSSTETMPTMPNNGSFCHAIFEFSRRSWVCEIGALYQQLAAFLVQPRNLFPNKQDPYENEWTCFILYDWSRMWELVFQWTEPSHLLNFCQIFWLVKFSELQHKSIYTLTVNVHILIAIHRHKLQLHYAYDFLDLLGWNVPIILSNCWASASWLMLRSINWTKLKYIISVLICTL